VYPLRGVLKKAPPQGGTGNCTPQRGITKNPFCRSLKTIAIRYEIMHLLPDFVKSSMRSIIVRRFVGDARKTTTFTGKMARF
jgi:hypothetical protein